MKMVKSLLLVSAAGVVAASGAQAADLPVKAKPVEYVKICSLYGAGFYYIPGTDICLKLGGYVRYQVNFHSGASISAGPFASTGFFNTRVTENDVAQRVRAIMTIDTRQQTAYGTLRTYFLMGYTHDSPTGAAPSLYATRGFIQIAGFTFGKATSFFDFASTAAVAYNAGYVHNSDTGDGGQLVAAYTAQLGNGVSASIAMEQSHRYATVNTVPATAFALSPAGGPGVFNYGSTGQNGSGRPDFTANLRIDQTWGSAQVAAAVHDVSGTYYTVGTTTEAFGHPDDEWGWAASVGLRLNAPMIAPGDYFQGMVIYSEGATKYATNWSAWAAGTNGIIGYWHGQSFGVGWVTDAVYGGTAAAGLNQIEKTTAWSAFASFEHFWTPSLRTSVYGNYLDISHNANATTLICAAFAQAASFNVASAQCDPDWRTWSIGSRTQWNITNAFYVGVDVIYQKLESVTYNNGVTGTLNPGSGKTQSPYRLEDQDTWAITWRVHRDIVP
jgi:hypothetical protein